MHKEKLILTLIFVLALGLRLVNIGQSFWLDEASQIVQSKETVHHIWFNRPADFQPPLFYVLANTWAKFGNSEAYLRLLPVFFGVLTVGVIYKLSKSTLAALFLAINPYHIYYSQEFRPYSLLGFLGTLSIYLLNIGSNWLFVVNGLLLYTHYASVFLLTTELIYILIFRRQKTGWFVLQLVLTGLVYLPWIPQLWLQFSGGTNIDVYLPGWRSVLTLSWVKAVPLIIFKFVAGRINIFPKWIYGIYIIFVFGVTALGLLLAKKQRNFWWMFAFLPIILSVLFSFFVPLTQPFRLIYCLPILVIIFSEAAKKYPKLIITLVVYICIFGNVLYFTRPRLQREQWRQAIGFLDSTSGSIVVKFSDKFAPFDYYSPNLPVVAAIGKFPAEDAMVRQKLQMANLETQVYVLDYLGELTDPRHVVDKTLISMEYVEAKAYNFEGVGIIKHYVKK